MTRLFLIGVAALAVSSAAAQTAGTGSAAGATDPGMKKGSTGTIGALSGSSTDPAAGGSAPAGEGPTGAVSNDTTNGSIGTLPPSSGQATKKHKAHSKSQSPQ